MQSINLDTRFETFIQHPQDASKQVRVARDLYTNKTYAKVAETIPGEEHTDAGLRARRRAVLAQNPIHHASPVAGFTGYWVEIPETSDPTRPADPKAAPAKAAVAQSVDTAPELPPSFNPETAPAS